MKQRLAAILAADATGYSRLIDPNSPMRRASSMHWTPACAGVTGSVIPVQAGIQPV